MQDARAIAEETARASYARLLAWLSSRTRDVAAAEDALADAFRAALESWPVKGIPDAPEAWLLTAARRKLIDGSRRLKTRTDATPNLTLAAEEAEAANARRLSFSGRADKAALYLRASGDRSGDPDAADVANCSRPRCRAHCFSVFIIARSDERSAGARKAQD